MTDMPDEIWVVPYSADKQHGEWDTSKWIRCPFVKDEERPKDETLYIRADHPAFVGVEGLLEDIVNCESGTIARKIAVQAIAKLQQLRGRG